jgi:hypothetical protein
LFKGSEEGIITLDEGTTYTGCPLFIQGLQVPVLAARKSDSWQNRHISSAA